MNPEMLLLVALLQENARLRRLLTMTEVSLDRSVRAHNRTIKAVQALGYRSSWRFAGETAEPIPGQLELEVPA